MIASAAARQPDAEASSATLPKILVIFSAGSGSPITPVEARKTSDALQPITAPAASATARAPAMPAWPVKALALPLLTTRARAWPRFSWARHQSTGAEAVLDWVKTPATSVPGARIASSTSVRLRYLIPASPVASLHPRQRRQMGKTFGRQRRHFGGGVLLGFRRRLFPLAPCASPRTDRALPGRWRGIVWKSAGLTRPHLDSFRPNLTMG